MTLPSNTHFVKYKGELLSVSEIARREGKSRKSVRRWIENDVFVGPKRKAEKPEPPAVTEYPEILYKGERYSLKDLKKKLKKSPDYILSRVVDGEYQVNKPAPPPRPVMKKSIPVFVEKKREIKIKNLKELHESYMERVKNPPPPEERKVEEDTRDKRWGQTIPEGYGTNGVLQRKMTPEEMRKYFPDKSRKS